MKHYGGDGNDSIQGGAGADQLSGDAGDDVLDGGADNDNLNGGTGNDILNGGAGNDWLRGDNGADTYVFGMGSGQDQIYNWDTDALGTNTDTIQLGAGLTADDIVLTHTGSDLYIGIVGTADTLRVQMHFSGGAWAVETLTFADGSSMDLLAI